MRDHTAQCHDPGDALLHPVALAALGLLLLNDHVLKQAWPGPVTGKLSDLAGLVLFPIVLVSGWELILALAGRWRRPSLRALGLTAMATATAFALMKTDPLGAAVAGQLFGLGRWLLALPVHALAGQLPPVTSTIVVVDPTDLVAVPAVALAMWAGLSRFSIAEPRAGDTPRRPSISNPTEP